MSDAAGEHAAAAAGLEEPAVPEAHADLEEPGASNASGEPAAATDIAFKPAEPEVVEAPGEDVPDAPAVFLEPKSADGEGRPAGG